MPRPLSLSPLSLAYASACAAATTLGMSGAGSGKGRGSGPVVTTGLPPTHLEDTLARLLGVDTHRGARLVRASATFLARVLKADCARLGLGEEGAGGHEEGSTAERPRS